MGKTILVVDDAAFMRMMLKNILEKNGYEIIEGKNGKEAFDLYEANKPDLVTLDITMPEVDGLTGLKMIHDKYPNANVVMCSAMGQQAMVMEAIQNGAKDFIVKPFQADRVLETVHKLVK